MRAGTRCLLLAAGMFLKGGANAQTADPGIVRTKHAAIAHSTPDGDATIVFQVPTGTELILVERGARAGFYRVIRRERGPQGWINAADAEVVHEAGDPPAEKTCAAALQQCPARGCEAAGTDAAETNERKRRQPRVGVPLTLSFADLAELQRQADERIGEGPFEPTAAQRAQLKNLRASDRRISEGDLVRVVGYVAKGDDGLHVNKDGESVNCMLKKPSENDVHIPLVEAPGNKEYQGMVAEMIPQDRPQAWSVDALRDVQAKGLEVWAEGALSYDKVHFVDADADNPLKDEPPRMTLWEIHPVTKFLVCRKDRCDPRAEDDWTPLETK